MIPTSDQLYIGLLQIMMVERVVIDSDGEVGNDNYGDYPLLFQALARFFMLNLIAHGSCLRFLHAPVLKSPRGNYKVNSGS